MILQMLLLLAVSDCDGCHARESKTQSDTPMGRTLTRVADSKFLAGHPDLVFSGSGFTYRIQHNAAGATYTVADNHSSITAPLVWAFGAGSTGQTYLFERNGAWYEAAVSFYPAIQALDWTPGHSTRTHRDLEEALGRKLEGVEVRRCFGCYSTSAKWNPAAKLESIVPGVSCERCHQNGAQHAAAVRKGDTGGAAIAKLATLGPEDLSAICGDCHSTWAEVAANGPRGILNVRHQFFRLAGSRCYDVADRRISCTSCHDLHAHTTSATASYDSRCQACHMAGKHCPVATSGCIGCHMPKIEIPGLHTQFTDHRIRVARSGQPYPD